MLVRLFGAVAVGDGAGTALGAGRSAAILAMLALRPGAAVGVDRLVDELWGADAPGEAEHALRVAVSRLRAALTAAGMRDVVATRAGGYALEVPRESVDLACFEDLAAAGLGATDADGALATLERALALWTDAPLAAFPYADFALDARDHLQELRREALVRWAELATEAGRADEPPAVLQAVLRDDRLHEGLWVAAARAARRARGAVDALRMVGRARAALGDGGLAPGPELLALEAELRGEVAPDAHPDPPHALPAPVDAFIGRERELDALSDLLRGRRLVTLVGPGGCGKTRLATEAGARARQAFADRVWFVDLVAADGPADVAGIMTRALGLGPWAHEDPAGALHRVLGDRAALLVLDNCEHVVEAAASHAQALLRDCAGLRVLATSREALRVPGEQVFTVPSLAVPERMPASDPVATSAPGAGASAGGADAPDDPVARIADVPAVALFVERSRSAVPGFVLTADNAPGITRITRALDGIPLAIELAAVRLRTLDVTELAARLDDLFTALGVGSRTALPRHRTLGAALDWSFALLEADEQRLLRALGALRSPFGLDAAAALLGRAPDATEPAMAGLVEKSLVLVVRGPTTRYRLLEPVRQFAARLAADSGERDAVVARRDDWFAALATGAGAGHRRFEQVAWRTRIRADRPNLLVAVESLARRGEHDLAADAALGLGRYWQEFGLYDEGRRMLRAVRAPAGLDDRRRGALLLQEAWLAGHRGTYGDTIALAGASLALADRRDDALARAAALNLIGSTHAQRGDNRAAREHLDRALALLVDRDPTAFAMTSINLAVVLVYAGRPHESRSAMAAAEAVPTGPEAHWARFVEGLLARLRGDHALAAAELDATIPSFERVGSVFHATLARVERALVAAESGDLETARRVIAGVLADADRGTVPLRQRMTAHRIAAVVLAAGGDADDALDEAARSASEARQSESLGGVAEAAETVALVLADREPAHAARLVAAAGALRGRLDLARDAWELERFGPVEADGAGRVRPGAAATDAEDAAADTDTDATAADADATALADRAFALVREVSAGDPRTGPAHRAAR
ncbi:BTAD domain-containing putative transcriptional regulator [Agromyces sp. SYSU T00194]|uniref:BTAD domain-containing putative transcriptional regulator n=1 Tax=Agromyces chitinivorans TaxID=3158560 RepID=UPI003393AC6D